MGEKEIAITVDEYKKLLEVSARVHAFADYVKRGKYNVDRNDCANFLGFELDDDEED